ncbi:MAG: hypothetical protein M3Q97_03635 [Bacteroidota bacterium]|nr:hypothetical protein [Bacteroidota bacterium]
MHQGLKKNERDLVRLTKYFIKRAEGFAQEGKLNEDQKNTIINSCQKLQDSLDVHAGYRETVLQNRENLAKSVKDNAICPKCNGSAHLKLIGIATHEKGWKSNKYRCRKCNTDFVWNRPNNPWDMIPFIESVIEETKGRLENEELPENEKSLYMNTLQQMHANLDMIKPVLEASDTEFTEMEEREKDMSRTVHEFKNYLMIEKIRMDVPADE